MSNRMSQASIDRLVRQMQRLADAAITSEIYQALKARDSVVDPNELAMILRLIQKQGFMQNIPELSRLFQD